MKVRVTVLLILAALVLAGFTGCASSGGGGGSAHGSASGNATAVAPGFGGDISVSITMANGVITDVQVTGDSETPTIGGVAVTRAPDIIKKYNSADIDTISGATITTGGIKEAAQAAIDKIVSGN
jgi:fumarate reductase flavoprotein subunit